MATRSLKHGSRSLGGRNHREDHDQPRLRRVDALDRSRAGARGYAYTRTVHFFQSELAGSNPLALRAPLRVCFAAQLRPGRFEANRFRCLLDRRARDFGTAVFGAAQGSGVRRCEHRLCRLRFCRLRFGEFAAACSFGAGASAVGITPTFKLFARTTATCADDHIASAVFSARSVQIANGFTNRRKGFSDFGSMMIASLGKADVPAVQQGPCQCARTHRPRLGGQRKCRRERYVA